MATNTPVNETRRVPAPLTIRLPPPPKIKLPFLDLPPTEADTLVYLHPVSPSPPLRCNSQKLLATGSPVFEKLLGPTCQFRLLRRKNLLKLGLPMGIKFVIDLSPPTEGEEAVETVEKFWCPDDILYWNSTLDGNYSEEDEGSPPSPELPAQTSNLADLSPIEVAFQIEMHKRIEGSKAREEDEKEMRREKPSYSHMRHAGAIERVLHIIHGLDPQIHTTPMWYTVHKVAVQLECTAAVQDHIISWLYANQNFIERYPTLALQIAGEIKNVDLFRDAFAILVGGQLLGRSVVDPGIFKIDESVSPEAAIWAKGVAAAKKSLQTRLERLYSYIESTEWLDNAELIPEYKKITDCLKDSATIPPIFRKLSEELDTAIRAEIKTNLTCLFAFSEDPGNSTGIDPWEKAVFDMIPGQAQIYSRVYWKQLASFPESSVSNKNIAKAVWEWERLSNAYTKLAEAPQAVETRNKNLSTGYTERILDVRPLKIRKPDHKKERLPISPTQTTVPIPANLDHKSWKSLNSERWKNLKGSLKLTMGSPSSSRSPTSENTLPPISSARATSHPTELPGIGEISQTALPPPTYESKTNLIDELPAYTEIASPGASIEVEKVGEKRKSRAFTDPDIGFSEYESDTDVEEIENWCKGKSRDYDRLLAAPPNVGRIEISNPMRKRRCSVEKDGDEIITEDSFYTQLEEDTAGEPEMFNISGVYEDTGHEFKQTRQLDKGKGKAIGTSEEAEGAGKPFTVGNLTLAYSDEIDNLYNTDPVGAAFDEAMALAEQSTKRSNLSSAIAYWRSSNTKIFAAENTVYGSPTIWANSENSATVARLIDHDWYSYTVQPRQASTEHKQHGQGSTTISPETTPSGSPLLDELSAPPKIPEYPYHNASRQLNPALERYGRIHTISMKKLWGECLRYLEAVGSEKLVVPISFEPLNVGEGQLLVCLGNEEWQYCPLWAGGMMGYSEDSFGSPAPDSTIGRSVELEVRDGRNICQNIGDGESSVAGSYDDCATEVESIGSFSTGGFSSFGVLSEFDSESEDGTIAGDTETKSTTASEVDDSATEAGDSDGIDSDEFEEIAWDSDDS